MLPRHIDFFAVFFIAVVMAAFSQLASIKLPVSGGSVHLQNAIASFDSCPEAREVLARLGIN